MQKPCDRGEYCQCKTCGCDCKLCDKCQGKTWYWTVGSCSGFKFFLVGAGCSHGLRLSTFKGNNRNRIYYSWHVFFDNPTEGVIQCR